LKHGGHVQKKSSLSGERTEQPFLGVEGARQTLPPKESEGGEKLILTGLDAKRRKGDQRNFGGGGKERGRQGEGAGVQTGAEKIEDQIASRAAHEGTPKSKITSRQQRSIETPKEVRRSQEEKRRKKA